jgi:hypothetical protein
VTYIARKQNIHLTKKQHISQNFTVQYKCNEQNTRYKKNRKTNKTPKATEYTETTKHEYKEEAAAGN